MSSDMTTDIFANTTYGLIALEKLGVVPDNFRLYEAGWLGDGGERKVMRVTGAEFRKAKSGPNKGKLSVMIPKTKQSAYVTAEEMGGEAP
jgi:hypothetical protein